MSHSNKAEDQWDIVFDSQGSPVLANQKQQSIMIGSPTLASETGSGTSARLVWSSAFRRSATLASATPAQAFQTQNVWKCPVLSGLTDLSGEKDASTDIQTTCDPKPSCPDRTLTGHALPPGPRDGDKAPPSMADPVARAAPAVAMPSAQPLPSLSTPRARPTLHPRGIGAAHHPFA